MENHQMMSTAERIYPYEITVELHYNNEFLFAVEVTWRSIVPPFIFLRILSLTPPILNVSRNPGSGGVLASKLIWFQLKLLAPLTVITSQFISISPKVSSSASQILQNASSTIPSLWSCTLRVKYPVRNPFSKLRLVLQMLQTNHAQNTISFKYYMSWLRYFVYNLSTKAYRKLYQYYSMFMKILFNYGYDGTKS